MSQSAKRLKLSDDAGRNWFDYQLGQGFDLSQIALRDHPFSKGTFETFVPADATNDIEFPYFPDVPGSEHALAAWLEDIASRGAASVVIEDDVRRKRDPHVRNPAAYLKDRVVHWHDLDATDSSAAAQEVKRGAFGYPLNAFVVSKSVEDLGLVDEQDAPPDLPQQVTVSLMAIIVSAFDNTSFAMWTRNE